MTRCLVEAHAHSPQVARRALWASPGVEVCDAALGLCACRGALGGRLVLATPASFTRAAWVGLASTHFVSASRRSGSTSRGNQPACGTRRVLSRRSGTRGGHHRPSVDLVRGGAPERPGAWLRVGGGGDRVHWSSDRPMSSPINSDFTTARRASPPGSSSLAPGPSNLRTFQSVLDAG